MTYQSGDLVVIRAGWFAGAIREFHGYCPEPYDGHAMVTIDLSKGADMVPLDNLKLYKRREDRKSNEVQSL